MTIPDVRSLAPLQINATVLPIADLQVSPEIATDAFRHSGNEFASAITMPGALPRVRWRTPVKAAIDLIGLKILKATAFDLFFALFDDGIRNTDASHTKIGLASGAAAGVFIRRFSVQDRGVCWAECEAIPLSADGMAYPLADPTTDFLPTLAGEPSLHTLGPSDVNGTVYGGALGMSCDLSPDVMVGLDGSPGDGLLYPMVATYRGGAGVLDTEHGDPIGLMAALGMIGVAVDGTDKFTQWLRDYDAANHVALATGMSLTIGSGRITPVEFRTDSGKLLRGGMHVEGLSVDDAHPVTVGTGSVPSLS